MISWKPFFERLSEEYEMAKKKKQALDNLLNTGRISQSTYELFNKEIDEAIAEIERQQKALLEKMDSKMGELEERVKTMEILLANFEEVYQREIGLLSMGLENARQELDAVREAVNQLSSSIQIPTTEVVVQQEMEPQPPENVEASQPEVEIVEEPVSDVEEKLPEPPAEPVEVSETDSFQTPQENPQETWQGMEESQSTETEAEDEENKKRNKQRAATFPFSI
ncbi:MAG: hypothetical protein QMD23_05955 [Candidatus Bathyarchaeia archaeon]|nr:hypothetical protein [Candidatus Bathyarchaeia archaeon]